MKPLERPTFQTVFRLLLVAVLVLLAIFEVQAIGQTYRSLTTPATWNGASIPRGSGQSRNWSGYVATGGSFTSVTGTWTVPTLTGGQPFATDASWVGIGGVNSNDLIQAGTEETTSRSGQARYSAWIETLPQPSKTVALTITPGDSVSVSLVQQAAGIWQVQLTDVTTGQNVQRTTAYASSLTSAEWIEEAPSYGRGLLPLANFGTLQFSAGNTVKNGIRDTLAQAGATMVTMIGARGQVEATPSALGTDGASFTVTRSTSTSVSPMRRWAGWLRWSD